MITVRYIGPEAAIMAGTYILHGETRLVTMAQLAEAQLNHPDGFVIAGGGGDLASLATAGDAAAPPEAPPEAAIAAAIAPTQETDEPLATAVEPEATLPPRQEQPHGRVVERSGRPTGDRRAERERRPHGKSVRKGR